MIIFSVSRLILWIRFVLVGIIIVALIYLVQKRNVNRYRPPSTIYYKLSEILTPSIFLVLVPLDLFFLYIGQDILFLKLPAWVEIFILSAGSLIYGIIGMEGISNIFFRSMKDYVKTVIAYTTISAVGMSYVLVYGLINHVVQYVFPIFSLFLSIGISATRLSKPYNPIRSISFHVVIVILSVAYIILFLIIY